MASEWSCHSTGCSKGAPAHGRDWQWRDEAKAVEQHRLQEITLSTSNCSNLNFMLTASTSTRGHITRLLAGAHRLVAARLCAMCLLRWHLVRWMVWITTSTRSTSTRPRCNYHVVGGRRLAVAAAGTSNMMMMLRFEFQLLLIKTSFGLHKVSILWSDM